MENKAPALLNLNPEKLSQKRGWLIGLGVLWLILIGVGTGWMMHFENTPGMAARPPKEWPSESQLTRHPGQATFVLLAHPQCSCTRATLAELAELMAAAHGSVTAHVLFYQPKGSTEDWPRTELWRTASAIPGVTVSADVENREAARFGGETSGSTLLFGADGRLRFCGGITDARGQFGESTGRLALVAMLAGHAESHASTAVFGCPLQATTTFRTP